MKLLAYIPLLHAVQCTAKSVSTSGPGCDPADESLSFTQRFGACGVSAGSSLSDCISNCRLTVYFILDVDSIPECVGSPSYCALNTKSLHYDDSCLEREGLDIDHLDNFRAYSACIDVSFAYHRFSEDTYCEAACGAIFGDNGVCSKFSNLPMCHSGSSHSEESVVANTIRG